MRAILIRAIAIALGLVVPIGAAELALRLLPVNEGLMVQPVNASNPVFHFAPNRSSVWSRDWDFKLVNYVRTNNAGFVNDQDYRKDDPRPLLAVVGDSYVEALMVPFGQTLHGRLAAASAPWGRVYSFGGSGAPLSQYLVWAQYAREEWNANALVIVVVGNDFDESLSRYKTGPGFHHYVEMGDGSLALKRFDFEPGWARGLVHASYLARYLVFNVHAHHHVRWIMDHLPAPIRPARAGEFVGNTSAVPDAERVRLSEAAVDQFLRDLQDFAGWSPEHVLFVVDGVRYPDAADALARSYFGHMRSYFMRKAKAAGFEVIDMDRFFFPRHAVKPVKFEFPTDGHWNGLAHGIAADAVLHSHVYSRWRSLAGPRLNLPDFASSMSASAPRK